MQRPPVLLNPDKKLIVLDVDDTLISVDSVGQVNPPRQAFFPDSVKRILELVKADPNVQVVIASKVSSTEEIKSAMNAITNIEHPNIHIHGKLDVRSNPQGKFGIVENVITEHSINPQNVAWVDDSFDDVEIAVTKGFTPILVPCFEAGAMRALKIESSSYLDCIPAIVAMDDRRFFSKQALLINGREKITSKNRYTQEAAQSLSGLYTQTASKYHQTKVSGKAISGPRALTKGQTLTPVELDKRAEEAVKSVFAQINSFSANSNVAAKISFLNTLKTLLFTSLLSLKENQKAKISIFLETDQFKNEKNPEVQQLLSSINKLLDTPVKVLGKLYTPLVSSVVKPQTGSDPLTRVSFNQSFVYRRDFGLSFPTYNADTGQNNLAREFAAANPDDVSHSGFKIQGQYVDKLDFNKKSEGNMSMDTYRSYINDIYLPKITSDKDLQEWAKYNAHMSGPTAACIQNLQLIFKERAEQNFIMNMELSNFNVYTEKGENNAVYFTARVPFQQALIEYKDNPEKIDRLTGEPTRYPAHANKNVDDHVAIYEITIKGIKTKEGVKTQIVSENFACYHARLLPAFNTINQLIEQRRFFDHLREEILTNINNFVVSAKDNTPSRGLFSSLFSSTSTEGAEIITSLQKKLAELNAKVRATPMQLDYEALSKELVNLMITEKQKYLAHPVTQNGLRLRDVLNDIIDNRSAQFKDRVVMSGPAEQDALLPPRP